MHFSSSSRHRRRQRRRGSAANPPLFGDGSTPLILFSLFGLLFPTPSTVILGVEGRLFQPASPANAKNAAPWRGLLPPRLVNTWKQRKTVKELDDGDVEEDPVLRSFPCSSVPALDIRQRRQQSSSAGPGGGGNDNDFPGSEFLRTCQDVSTKFLKRRVRVPVLNLKKVKVNWRGRVPSGAGKVPLRLLSTGGGFYGVAPQTVDRYYAGTNTHTDDDDDDEKKPKRRPKPQRMKESMSQALDELRLMRGEMEALRKELHDMRRQVGGEEEGDEGTTKEGAAAAGAEGLLANQKRQRRKRKLVREYEGVARDIEKWAEEMLLRGSDQQQEGANGEDKDNGWTRVQCNKMFEQTYNANDRTSTYVKWMKDARGKHATADDDREYPCLKVYSTIDAPHDEVCLYLSQPQNVAEYNDLLDKHKDLEVLTPHSKICWGRTPQILFVKPRVMITFCSHRWLGDGTQLVVNQACEYDEETEDEIDKDSDAGAKKKKKKKKTNPRAYALRGANYIAPDPDDPEKTLVRIVCHANPGADVPQWASRAAINSLAPLEPYKLFHKINQGIAKHREELQKGCRLLRDLDETEMVASQSQSSTSSSMTATTTPEQETGGGATPTPDISNTGRGMKAVRRPAGLAQLGYACFWPEGGGIQEGDSGGIVNQSRRDININDGERDGASSSSAPSGSGDTTTDEGDKAQGSSSASTTAVDQGEEVASSTAAVPAL